MNFDCVKPVVEAALYEGYVLYPYRSSAIKNRQRWTFGGVYPRDYFRDTGGAEPCDAHAEVLLRGGAATRVSISVRFLQPIARDLGALVQPLAAWRADREPAFTPVGELEVGARRLYAWQEAVERSLDIYDGPLGGLEGAGGGEQYFEFDAERDLEPVADDDGCIVGVIVRSGCALRGRVSVSLAALGDDLYRLALDIENITPVDTSRLLNREQASLYSFASTHGLLGVEDGAFISLMDPPESVRAEAAACDNRGLFPVLVGDSGRRNMLLCSPIILYDYPQIAPESPGDLFDSTEIDEILSLRILSMTDAEKREMAAADPRTAAMLRRTEALGADDFMRMHGTLREPQCEPRREPQAESAPWAESDFRPGDRVRLRPQRGGDAMDLLLAGKTAVIESIERDYDNGVHLAVVIDDDPGREWGVQRMPGHRFFYKPDEVELVADNTEREVAS